MQQKPIYSNSFKQFLSESDSRICNILHRLDLKDRPSSIVTTKDINYITNRNDGTMSYLPSNREHIMNENFTWSRKGREQGKPSRVIRKLFNDKFISRYLKDVDFEEFANLYKKQFNSHGLSFELLPCGEIGRVYDMPIAQGGGSLNSSCMRRSGSYMKMYMANSDMQILTLTNKDGELCGRSLVWHNVKNDYSSDRISFMDRIYVTEDFMYQYFLDYAKDKGWWRKSSYDSRTDEQDLINPSGEYHTVEMKVYLDTDFDEYPYIDTFHYGSDGWISNSSSSSDYVYNDTDGGREGDSRREWDEYNERYIDSDDARYVDHGRYSGHYLHEDDVVWIDGDYWWDQDDNIVEIDGKWYTKDDDDIVCVDDEWYRTDSDEIAYCECTGDYELWENVVYTDNGYCILKSNAVEVDGKIYHKDNVNELV